jgi:exodeoxyribonuclease VII large subunit
LFKTKVIETTVYKLSDLLDEIQILVRSTFDRSYWVVGEIASISEAKNGHLYLELAEKQDDNLQAKVRANLWANSKKRLLSEFEFATSQSLKKGMKVLLNVVVDFHPIFGLSLTILDIDASFSLGEIERQKQLTLNRLEQEGLLDFNQQHVLPPVIQNIAIISSATAAGFQDFMKQLKDNDMGYTFNTVLFQATMQGEKAASSIVQAFNLAELNSQKFDILVLIRGGGSSLDLSCFDEFDLAVRIAQSVFPVFTGIGHERDFSIADRVAHTHLKTPTAVAEYILSVNWSFEQKITTLNTSIIQFAKNRIYENHKNLHSISRDLSYAVHEKMNRSAQLLQNKNHLYQKVVNNKLKRAGFDLEKFTLIFQHDLKRKLFSVFQKLEINSKKLTKLSKIQFQNTKYLLKIKQQIIQKRSSDALQTNSHELNQLEQILHLADPRQILKRGFSITRYNGKIIRQLKDLEDNALICTEIDGGKIESIIIKKNNNEQKTDL